ncbi:MAG: DUF1902 domain-containing protein [Gammaproteobacteria bacterium]|nr:MAG: DUF1902 domain-containing protein [Gammaproteobacteria bacterium]
MEKIINLHIEKLPEGVYLATSDSIAGLVAQGDTLEQTLNIASDVALKLIEAQQEAYQNLPPIHKKLDHPLVVSI